MNATVFAKPLVRALVWATILPFIGVLILCVVFPPFIVIVLFGSLLLGPKIIYVIVTMGFIPSLLTAAFYFGLAWRWGTTKSVAASIAVAVTSCCLWWALLDLLWTNSNNGPPSDMVLYLCGVSAAATAVMVFGERSNSELRAAQVDTSAVSIETENHARV